MQHKLADHPCHPRYHTNHTSSPHAPPMLARHPYNHAPTSPTLAHIARHFWNSSRRLYFFLLQRKSYILFSITFLIFWNSTNLAYVSQLGNEDLVSDYICTTQRESYSVPDIGFLLTFNYFVPFGVIENRFTKINFK